MDTMHATIQNTKPGTPMAGGFFAGCIRLDGQPYVLIFAPKDGGEHGGIAWNNSQSMVEGATSYNDGLANTAAMAEAGSDLAKWAQSLAIGDYSDWYLPSQDELEILYRNLKPTTTENYCYARSGINLSAVKPTRPYTPEVPAQTAAVDFQACGPEAFEEEAYWSSTQHASEPTWAWYQYFDDGLQITGHKDNQLRARAVRRLPI